jgi:hypothetical protein
MVDNGGTDATPRSRALCSGFCGELSRSALLLTVFLIYIIFIIIASKIIYVKIFKNKIFTINYLSL